MEDMNKIKIIDLKSPILNIIFSFINQKKKLNIIIKVILFIISIMVMEILKNIGKIN